MTEGVGASRFIRGFATCRRDGWRVSLLPGQKSSMLRSLIECNVLVDLPAGHPPLEPGTEVSLLPLVPLPYGKGENNDEGNE